MTIDTSSREGQRRGDEQRDILVLVDRPLEMHAVERRFQLGRRLGLHRQGQRLLGVGAGDIVEFEEIAGVAFGQIVEPDGDVIETRPSGGRGSPS